MTKTKPVPVERSDLLQALENVEPGLSPTPTVEQANCLTFRNGRVSTFDGETCCSARVPLPKELTVVVQGGPLLEALRALDVEAVEVWVEGDKFYVKGRRDRVYVRCTAEVLAPLDAVDAPAAWTPLTPEFSEALAAVAEVPCEKDDHEFLRTVVHVTPKFVQATDGFSFCRYRVATGVGPSLIRGTAAKAVAARGPSKVGQTANWLHYRTPGGVRLSVRRFDPADNKGDKLERFDAVVKQRGRPVQFPKSVVAASKVAEVFANEYSDDKRVTITLKPGHVRLTGEGVTGGSEHSSKVSYDGPETTFRVGPKILAALVEKHSEVEVAEKMLLVVAGRMFYATSVKDVSARKPETTRNGQTTPGGV